MKFWKAFLFGLLILLGSNIIISVLLRPYLTFVSDKVWDSLGISFAVAFMVTYNMEIRETKTSVRMQKVITYLYAWVVVFAIYYGLSFIW